MNVKTVRYGSTKAARELTESLLETGFAVLTDHPIPTRLIADTYREWTAFFASPRKRDHTFNTAVQAGYFPFRSENAKDSPIKDLKEFYHHYPSRKALPSGVDRYTPELHRRLVGLAGELLEWIEDQTPPEVRQRFPLHLSAMIEGSTENLLRILHYPPLDGTEERGAVRAAAHEDINLITLLPAATESGLEVKAKDGRWHAVSSDPGMIVINSGDMLKETSSGHYPSTTHRVVNPAGPDSRKSRYSMPFFLHPRSEALLTAQRTAGEFLNERLREIGLIPTTLRND
jgi:isopenicillin N synthase-like dioxygenase